MNFILYPNLDDFLESKINYDNLKFNKIDNIFISLTEIEKDKYYLFSDDLIIRNHFINNGLLILIGSNLIIDGGYFENNGSVLFLPSKKFNNKLTEFYLKNNIMKNYANTGLIIHNDIKSKSFLLRLSGPPSSNYDWKYKFIIKIGKREGVPCYFSRDGGKTASDFVKSGDVLYWNSNYSGINLYSGWKIEIIYK